MEDFLLPLADLVEELKIESHSEVPLPPLPMSALKLILSRQKCNELNVEDIVISLAEAERLVQVFIYNNV